MNNLPSLYHDLGNVLMAVCAAFELGLGKEIPETPETVRLGKLLAQAVTLCGEIQDNLRSSETDNQPIEAVTLEMLKDEVLGAKSSLESFGVSLEVDAEESHGRALAHLGRFKKIARNLVVNAANAGAKRVRIHFASHPCFVEAIFADDGRGMGPDELIAVNCPRPGVRGVEIVRALVGLSGGTVCWESRKGIGTWVTVRFSKLICDPRD